MEFMLVHKPIGMLPPEAMKNGIEQSKKLVANPQAFVPGVKSVTSYWAIGSQQIFCLWDVPSMDALAPLLRQMMMSGWNTEVIPVEKGEVAIANMEKMMQEMQTPAMAR